MSSIFIGGLNKDTKEELEVMKVTSDCDTWAELFLDMADLYSEKEEIEDMRKRYSALLMFIQEIGVEKKFLEWNEEYEKHLED